VGIRALSPSVPVAMLLNPAQPYRNRHIRVKQVFSAYAMAA
jgi:hypothetical protein